MLRTFQNIARSEILGDDDRHSTSRRSTKSMFEDTNYDRFCRTRRCNLQTSSIGPDDTINAKVRKAIENSFIKQMEENAALEHQLIENEQNHNEQRFSPDGSSEKTNLESLNSIKKSPDNSTRRKKSRAPSCPPTKELPDMITELPTAKLQAKKIMDAVIKEMVDVKAIDHHKISEINYEIDSLERINRRRHEGNIECSSLPSGRKMEPGSKTDAHNQQNEEEIMRKNYYNSLPELISQRNEGYSLVSEVYVNDGYASPANSDDSGPEICYKPEKPGHLTIKVQDSPENYVKLDDSEYEPDTLDRKPMKLKINGDVIYEKETANEIYVDSLERPTQILLKSKGSFRDDGASKNGSLARGYGSLREIYEARLRMTVDSNLMNGKEDDNSDGSSWKKTKYLTPESRQARRQRKQNQPDVVPLPPMEGIYQHPKSPRKIVETSLCGEKNERDRRVAEAGSPTASQGPSVQLKGLVGNGRTVENYGKSLRRCCPGGKVEDSGYLSSTESNESNNNIKQFKYEFGSVSETDETESICDGASESGAESVGTDSVFFGNFRRLSNVSTFSKSIDSGVDTAVMGGCFVGFGLERQTSFNASDSENESFVTVLPHGSRCDSIH